MLGQDTASEMTRLWQEQPRWQGIKRPYTAGDVLRLRGTIHIEHTLARRGAERLWQLLQTRPYIKALGALTGGQAVQMVQAGLEAIYLSGWQVAADGNDILHTYPDQSLYPVDSAPNLVRRLNNALLRSDQISHLQGKDDVDWLVPIVADAESGFGGPLNTFELIKNMIEAGAAAVHLEDQLSSAKKCGHMGGKVLVPVSEFVGKLAAARLAADVLDIPTVIIARTDADAATLIRSDIDPLDQKYLTGERSAEGHFYLEGGLPYAIERALAYAPYADVLWCETSRPDLGEAREFAQAIQAEFPGKFMAYNCSPSFNWRRHMSDVEAARFQEELGAMGYKFQFVTLAGFHALNMGMFELAQGYKEEGMAAYSRLQQREFELEREYGYAAVKHQTFVGAGYFDEIQLLLSGGKAATTAMGGSTEEAQFQEVVAGD